MVAGHHQQALDVRAGGHHVGQRDALDERVVRRRDAAAVLDAERGRGVALRVEVDDQHPLPELGQRGGDVDGGRGLADAALLVRDHDDPGRVGAGQRRPHQCALPREHDVLRGAGERGAASSSYGAARLREVGGGPHRCWDVPPALFHVKPRARFPRGQACGEGEHPVDNHAQRATQDRWITPRAPDPASRVRRPGIPSTCHSTPLPPGCPACVSAPTTASRRLRRRGRGSPTYPRRIGPRNPDRRGGGRQHVGAEV